MTILTCPKCGSDLCRTESTKWQYDTVIVYCYDCEYYAPRPEFSGMAESDFAICIQQYRESLLGK